MKKVMYYLPSIIFNLIETLIIFLIGRLLELRLVELLIILVLFSGLRIKLGGALHYKSPKKCILWTTLVFTVLFLIFKVNPIIGIVITAFSSIILTDKGNTKGSINDMFMWKGKSSKYEDIDEYIKYNSMDVKLIEYEDILKKKDTVLFLLYKYRFKENLTFSEISEKLKMSNSRISEKLDNIALSIRVFCGI